MLELINRLLESPTLESHDPYDVWTTEFGSRVKRLYHTYPRLAAPVAAATTLADRYINNTARVGYRRREYASVRAVAVQAATLLYRWTNEERYLRAAERHIEWLIAHSIPTAGGGIGWGHGFPWVVSSDLTYAQDAPLSTTTPYILEALVLYTEMTGSDRYVALIRKIIAFYNHGLFRMVDNGLYYGPSYANVRDRLVTNAISYVMYGYALSAPFVAAAERLENLDRARRIKQLIEALQRCDGSWLYTPYEKSFIDCFHSCFVVKNLLKTESRLGDKPSGAVNRGYEYIKTRFYVPTDGLMKRFSVAPRSWVAQYDLYDNAEAVIVASLIGDVEFAAQLMSRVQTEFVRGEEVYSEIHRGGMLRNANMLRWAVTPAFLAYLLVNVPGATKSYLSCGGVFPTRGAARPDSSN